MTKNTQLAKIKQLLDEPMNYGDISLFPLLSNKPTNPDVGDCWADAETLEIQTWDGNNWIILTEPPTSPLSKLEFGDNDTGFTESKGDELTLIAGGVETLKIEPDKMCIYNNYTVLVSIDTKTGDIEYGENYDPDETAKIFWESLSLYPHKEQAAQDVLFELRTILGVKENESICSIARALVTGHKKHCNWHTWNHYYSWNESDCTCEVEMMDFTTPPNDGKGKGSKVETLPGGNLDGLDDIQYFEERIARAMKLGHPTDKLEKQIELLKDSIVIYKEHRPSELENAIIYCPYIPECFESAQNKKAFDEAMKVIE